jgi:UPF0716 protein FxsA
VGLLLFFFPILEIITIVRVGGAIGFANTVFAFIAAGVLGFGIVKSQGRFLLGGLQSTLAKGELPANRAMHSALIFVGGVGLMAPGFLSDAVGLMFILPGSRHLIARYLKKSLERKLRSGGFQVFTMGNMGGFGGFGASTSQPPPRPGEARDVSPREIRGDVIDVEVVSATTTRSNRDEDPTES